MNDTRIIVISILLSILTSSAFATIVASIITSQNDRHIARENNHTTFILEDKRYERDRLVFRYTKLYQLLIDWNTYQSEIIEADDYRLIAKTRLLNGLGDSRRREQLMTPLLDPKFKSEFKSKYCKCEDSFKKWLQYSKDAGINPSERNKLAEAAAFQTYVEEYIQYANLISNSIESQLEELLFLPQKQLTLDS